MRKGFLIRPAVALLWTAACWCHSAVVSGRVKLDGAPEIIQLETLSANYGRIRGTVSPWRTNHWVDVDGGLAEALVYVKSGLEKQTFPAPTEPARMYVENFQYRPRTLALRTGQELRYLLGAGNAGAMKIWTLSRKSPLPVIAISADQPVVSRRFEMPELFLLHQSLDYPWMEAHVSVLDHPFFAVTDSAGRFRFPESLPPGTYTIAARHAHTTENVREVTIEAGQTGPISLDFQLKPGTRNLSGDESLQQHLENLKIDHFRIRDHSLGQVLERLDEALRTADPNGRPVLLMLDPKVPPPKGSSKLPDVRFKPFEAPKSASAIDLLQLLLANANSPITNHLTESGIRFSFRASGEREPDLSKLDPDELKKLQARLARSLEQQRGILEASHPTVMNLRQRLARIGSRLAQLDAAARDIEDPIVNRSYRISPNAFRQKVLSLVPPQHSVRPVFPEGIASSWVSHITGEKRKFLWAIKDQLEANGVKFTDGYPRIYHNTLAGSLFASSRKSQVEKIRQWVEFISRESGTEGTPKTNAPAQLVLVETKWIELPLALGRSVPSFRAGIPGVISGYELSRMLEVPMLAGSAKLPLGVLSPNEFKELMSRMRHRQEINLLTTPRVVAAASKPAEMDALKDQEIIRPGSPAEVTPRTMQTEKIKIGPAMNFVAKVDPATQLISLQLNAHLVSFVGYADPKAYFPGGERSLKFPITREIRIRGGGGMPNGHTLMFTGAQTNQIYDYQKKVVVPREMPLRRKTIFSSRKKAERKALILFVTATLIDAKGDPIRRD